MEGGVRRVSRKDEHALVDDWLKRVLCFHVKGGERWQPHRRAELNCTVLSVYVVCLRVRPPSKRWKVAGSKATRTSIYWRQHGGKKASERNRKKAPANLQRWQESHGYLLGHVHGCREPPTKSLSNVWHSTSFRGISPSWYHGMVRETYSYPWHECINHIFLLFFKNQSIPIKECFSKHHVAGVITATLSPVSYLAPPSVTGQFSLRAQKKL